jgi:ribosomal protein S27AE
MTIKAARQRAAKTLCRQETKKALWRGKLVRKEACERCGAAQPVTHHVNYAEPLNILWLCRKCHAAEHAALRSAGVVLIAPEPRGLKYDTRTRLPIKLEPEVAESLIRVAATTEYRRAHRLLSRILEVAARHKYFCLGCQCEHEIHSEVSA